jgi:apolipoprotein N-acyltransferase
LAWLAWARSGHPLVDGLAFAAVWLAAELARGQWFTGFPWGALGYGQIDGLLGPVAPWFGVYGIGALVALAAAWTVGALFPHRSAAQRGMAGTAALLLVGGATSLPQGFTEPAGTLRTSLVQTAIDQSEKFEAQGMALALVRLETALQQAQGALIVAPETAIPVLPQDLSPAQAQRLQRATPTDRAVLVGAPLEREGDYTNALLAWWGGGGPQDQPPAYRYDKHHLVPFGEFIPTGFRWFVHALNIPLGDFARGDLVQPPLEWAGQRVGPTICYEDLFGEELARRFTDPAMAPTVLANVSNIAWFGKSLAIQQHLQIARMRSRELERPTVRATNTGATTAIDHQGQVVALLPPWEVGVLEVEVEGREGLTPYATWAGRRGLAPLWLLALACMVGVTALRRLRGGA